VRPWRASRHRNAAASANHIVSGGSKLTRPLSFHPPLDIRLLLLDELRDAWRVEARIHRVALVVICVVGVVLRLGYLGQPMRYDESITYLFFARRPWADALSLYTYPNNHLFHTLLVKASVAAFGDTPWAIRLPAFLAGVLVIPAAYSAARALYGAPAALMAAAIVASSGALTLYATNARGYSLIVLAFLLLVMIGARLLKGGPSHLWFTFAVVAALGLWTVPTMLFPLGAVAVWLALSLLVERRGAELRRLATALGVTVALAVVAYWPVITREGIAAVTRNRFVASSGWFEFFEQLPATIREALASWALGGLLTRLLLLALAACAIIAVRRHTTLTKFRVGIPVAAYAFCAWLLVVTHRAPFARVWLWLLPLAAALAGAGALVVFKWWRATDPGERATAIASVTLALLLAVSLVRSGAVLTSRDTGTYRDAPEATAVLSRSLQPGDRVLVALPTNGPLGMPASFFSQDERKAQRVVVVVDQGEGQTLDAIVAGSLVRDTTQFAAPTVVARLPGSILVQYVRRNASP
jgi:Dolichyl-phosphate-mannose-protein mannosyltransferase